MKLHLLPALAALGGLVLSGCAFASGTTDFADKVTGQWQSVSCEPFPQPDGSTLYMQRAVDIGTERWALEVTTYGDAECSFALLDIGVAGEITVEARAEMVDGAWNTLFGHDELSMTARNDQSAGMLMGAGCGSGAWTVGEAQDVTENGCLFLPSVSACPAEYDLLGLTGEELRFGLRMANLCDPANRPTQLEYAPLVRAGN